MNIVNQLQQTSMIECYFFPKVLLIFLNTRTILFQTSIFSCLIHDDCERETYNVMAKIFTQNPALMSLLIFDFLKVILTLQLIILLKINTTNINATHALYYDLICLT